jgi:threonyl-tRNA synthetase
VCHHKNLVRSNQKDSVTNPVTMGKEAKKGGAEKAKNVSIQSTSKFSVMEHPDAPPQPKEEAPSKAASGGKEGLQGRRTVASSSQKIASSKLGGSSFVKRESNPAWLQHRLSIYDQIKAKRTAEFSQRVPIPISITMPDGKTLTCNPKDGDKAFMAYVTTPLDIALSISQGLADSIQVARVTYSDFAPDYSLADDGMTGVDEAMSSLEEVDEPETKDDSSDKKTFLWDLSRPLVGNVALLEFLKFENDDPDAKTVFWHSSAHVLGEALEHAFGVKLTIGPPLAGGFYYDSFMGQSDALKDDDCK